MKKADFAEERDKEASVDRKLIHQGKVIALYGDQFTYQDGEKKFYERVTHPGAVVIIPIDSRGRIVFIKQWRRAVSKVLIELPAGVIEEKEDPKTSAQRELREEIGMAAKEMLPFGGMCTVPGFCDEYLHLFIGRDLSPQPLVGDDSEEIDPCPLSLETACQLVQSGEIIDAKTIVGIYRYKEWVEK